jgi:hypothetical protein
LGLRIDVVVVEVSCCSVLVAFCIALDCMPMLLLLLLLLLMAMAK